MKADFTIFFSLVLAVAFVRWDWPNIAKIMPVYIAAIPGLVLVQLYRETGRGAAAAPLVAWIKRNSLLKNSDSRLFKKVQMRGAREIDERRRIY
jgi:hypothetical protein